jgi:hypothetical protein
MKRRTRVALWAGGLLTLLVAAIAVPVASVEYGCVAPAATPRTATPLVDAPDRRQLGDSYLTYPEWYIVHAYADLAGVTRQSSESAYDYLAGISGFWSSLCRATEIASRTGTGTASQKTTNYVIGLSFTAEMLLQGAYERSIGAVSAWWRGPQKTAEDALAVRMRADYADFLRQTPWYRYPFGSELERLWSETPFVLSLRALERRLGLSLEWGGKYIYAKVLRYAAGYDPAVLTLRSVVTGLDESDIRTASVIETPRYRTFTEIARGLGARGRSIVEIAGNTTILTTILKPQQTTLSVTFSEIFSLPLQSRLGWRRIGLDMPVPALAAQIGAIERQGAEFEHAYDY